MEMTVHQVTTLPKDTLDNICEEFPDFTPNSSVILIGRATSLEIYRDLFLYANRGIMGNVKNTTVAKHDFQKGDDKFIDDQSHEFLLKLSLFNESLFNSSSLRQPSIKGLEEFDKIELKRKLQQIVDIL
tara:strand:- start:772 stop:1158 length:387 start_codon:yes stop_codon:yes gene_type:complete